MSAPGSLLTDRRRVLHPKDYKRSPSGRVLVEEINHWLPFWRCRECGMWLNGDEFHDLEICDRARTNA